MDLELKAQQELNTCVALAFAVSAMLCEISDAGAGPAELIDHTDRVMGLLQEGLGRAKALMDSAIINRLGQ